MITLSRYNELESLWDEIKQDRIIPDEIKCETERKLLRNKLEVRVNYTNHRIDESDLQHRLYEHNNTIALVEPLVKEVSVRLGENSKLWVADTNGVILFSQDEEIVGYCCPAAEMINKNMEMRSLLDMGSALEVHYDNGINSQLVPVFNERGELQFLWGISDHRPITEEYSTLLYLAAQLVQQRYKYSLIVDEYTTSLMNAISDCVVLLDENGRIMNANEHCLGLLRIDNKGIIKGMQFSRLLSSYEPQDAFASGPNCDGLKSFTIQVWNEKIPCRVSYQEAVYTPYGMHMVLLFDQAERNYITVYPANYNSDSFGKIIGNSSSIQRVKKMGQRAAKFAATVLIEGESGTGKELLAEAIHQESRRSGKFVAINCGAIPSELIQSELFGYEEGAFTGAKRRGNAGKLEIADGGTLFLDEIGEMPLEMQVSLLRFLQDRNVVRVGGHNARKVDVRIIAATNRNLKEEVRKGNFREDLYYRLNIINLQIPPLRNRLDDIPLLVDHFIDKLSNKYGIPAPIVSRHDIKVLINYHWPGNVRELENVLERAIILSPGEKLIMDFAQEAREDTDEVPNFAQIEKDSIEKYLALFKGNISQTANALGITRQTLYKKIKNFAINREAYI